VSFSSSTFPVPLPRPLQELGFYFGGFSASRV
jgi:hypothetical protein